jgi:integron integrase
MTKRDKLVEAQIERTRDVIRRQHKSLATEICYLGWLRRYFRFVFTQPPEKPSEKKFEAFLTMLARDQDVSASTQNQAFNAILFFYRDVEKRSIGNVDALRATRPSQIRRAPSVRETHTILAEIKDVGGYPTNLICRMLYGCGLRLMEPLNLRIKDVQFDDMRLFILCAKGGKDRVVNLPFSLVPEIKQQMVVARSIWEQDRRNKIPLEISHRLGEKYPETRFSWEWEWLFPQHHPCKHPRTKGVVRFHMHEANIQRAVKDARKKVGVFVTPHNFRHAYGTHSLDGGVNIKALSEAMGHKQIETTAGYCHADALSVPSPLDMRLPPLPTIQPQQLIAYP